MARQLSCPKEPEPEPEVDVRGQNIPFPCRSEGRAIAVDRAGGAVTLKAFRCRMRVEAPMSLLHKPPQAKALSKAQPEEAVCSAADRHHLRSLALVA